jgi:hypothetical protein
MEVGSCPVAIGVRFGVSCDETDVYLRTLIWTDVPGINLKTWIYVVIVGLNVQSAATLGSNLCDYASTDSALFGPRIEQPDLEPVARISVSLVVVVHRRSGCGRVV